MNWFWHAVWIAIVVIPVTLLWISALFHIIVNSSLPGWSRALWVIVIFLLPILGALVYLVVNGNHAVVTADGQTSSQAAPGRSADLPAQLQHLADLHRAGDLSDAEFATAKAALID
ncbi:hypothetical protein J2X46_004047 [Nocardioides sp. BE266]|nr:hypothetical protein [Nocardioides sp. BE266]